MALLTPHFSLEELACADGTPVPAELHGNALAIAKRAQTLRTLLGSPLEVRSGFRTRAWNRRVGGATRSYHLTASALDLHSEEWGAEELATLYEGLVRLGYAAPGGLGVYPRADGGWIHIDLGAPRSWRDRSRYRGKK